MKVMRIRVEYGKNAKYVTCDWVVENAMEQYKEYWTKRIRENNWKKEINFKDTGCYCEADDNGTGILAAFTLNGYSYNVRVK